PSATRVKVTHSEFGDIEVKPFVASSPDLFYDYLIGPEVGATAAQAMAYQGEGWVFADSARTAVTLTPGLCADVTSGKISLASIQSGCPDTAVCGAPPPVMCMNYVFDTMCAPELVVDTSIDPPDVLLMLDRSSSMRYKMVSVDCLSEPSCKWNVAKEVIKDLITATQASGPCTAMDDSGCDEIKLGFGFFETLAQEIFPPAEDSGAMIESWLDDVANIPAATNAKTNTGDAAELIHDSAELAVDTSVGIGLIITDGDPSGIAAASKARDELCAARDRGVGPVSTYVVGFGADADARMNSYMAAAGGTGACCEAASGCLYDPSTLTLTAGTPVDPCVGDASIMLSGNVAFANLRSDYECFGSIETANGTQLRDALLRLAAGAACTIPVDVPAGYPGAPSARENPFATRVTIDHSEFGLTEVKPYVAATPNLFYDHLIGPSVGAAAADAMAYQGEGWVFANSTRTLVQLTPGLCSDVLANKISKVATQPGCPDALGCGPPVLCPNVGQPCRVSCGTDPSLPCDSSGTYQVGRCGEGVVTCVLNAEVCTQQFGALPEICNGLDDNCDGTIDNLDSAEPGNTDPGALPWDAATYPLNDASEMGLFCDFENTCACGQAPGDSGAVPGPTDTEWSLLLDAGIGMCTCGTGLEGDVEYIFGSGEDTNYAGCAAGGMAGGAGGLGLIWVLAMAVGFRRRMRA
ncbi:MAG: vWA domain-containing protein, partial [Myxococcota bacterium]